MIAKISRLFLILLVILITATLLPKYYWISFEKRILPPTVYFSPVKNDFIIGRAEYNNYFWQDRNGQRYKRSEVDSLLPFMNYRLLASRSKFPDSLQGIKIELEDVRKNNIFTRIRAKDIRTPQIPLYPLFESRPPRLKLQLPKSFFRITERMEFINAETNEIDEQQSEKFTAALQKKNFIFPAKKIFGNPTTRKPFDEGYFIVDAANGFFHLKMIHGKPFCKKIEVPANLKIKAAFIKEMELKEFYGLIISKENDVYVLLYDHYRLQKLPIEGYNADEDKFLLRGNLFHRTISVYSGNSLSTYVTDRNYKMINTYSESWPGTMDNLAGKISAYIFPFALELNSPNSRFIHFYFQNFSGLAGFLNIILAVSLLFIRRYRGILVLKRWYDLAIVLLFGIYGYIAVLLFENTDV